MQLPPTIMQWEVDVGVEDYQRKQIKRQSPRNPAFSLFHSLSIYFLNNFFLPYPASPINPDPRRSMVAGSGTAEELMDASPLV